MCVPLRRILKGTWPGLCPSLRLPSGPFSTRWVRARRPPSSSRAFVGAGTGSSSSAGLREAAAWHRANRGAAELQRTVPLCPEKAPVGAQLPLRPTPAALGLELGWSLGSWLRPHRLPAVHRVTLSLLCTPDSMQKPRAPGGPSKGTEGLSPQGPQHATPHPSLPGRNP